MVKQCLNLTGSELMGRFLSQGYQFEIERNMQLEFELVNFDVTVQEFSHYATVGWLSVLCDISNLEGYLMPNPAHIFIIYLWFVNDKFCW